MRKTVYWIEGDGIGPDVWKSARPVIDEAIRLSYGDERGFDWKELLAGEKALKETGTLLPDETLAALRGAELAIKGPLGTPVGTGFRSLNVTLRQTLDLYACIRPIRYFEGIESPVKHPERVDMIVFRENTEDVYAGIEYKAGTPEAAKLIAFLRDELGANVDASAAVGIKPMTEKGSKRLVRAAIRHALAQNLPSVTLVHKGNIMKFTEGAFRQHGYDVAKEEFAAQTVVEAEAASAPGKLVIKDRIADAMFQEALIRPEQYSVLATPQPERRLHFGRPRRAGRRPWPCPRREHVGKAGLLRSDPRHRAEPRREGPGQSRQPHPQRRAHAGAHRLEGSRHPHLQGREHRHRPPRRHRRPRRADDRRPHGRLHRVWRDHHEAAVARVTEWRPRETAQAVFPSKAT